MTVRARADRTGDILRELLQPVALADPYAVYERLRREQAAGQRSRLTTHSSRAAENVEA